MQKNKLFILLLLIVFSAKSQDTKSSFSLQEAIDYALEHNRNIKNATLSIEAAERQKWETISIGLPQISGKIEYQKWLKQQFPGQDFNNDGTIDFLPKQTLTPSVTVSQLIFDGSYLVGLRAIKVFLDITKNAKEKTINEIKTAVVDAYSNILLSKENIEIMNKNITSLKKNLEETKLVFENGLTEEEDVEQLQLTLYDLKNTLKNLKNLHIISKGFLKLLLGIESNRNISLTENLEALVKQHLNLEMTIADNFIFNNIDYKIAKNDVESKRLLYKSEQSKQLPVISAFLNSNYIGNSNTFSFFKKEQEWIPTTLVGANITIPIFTSFRAAARRKIIKIDWDISKNNLEETEEKLKLNIQKSKSEYILAIDTYENKKKNLMLAEKIEDKNNTKYKEGIASSFELRQAQTQLYSAQQEYLKSMIDVINKKTALKNILNIQ